MKIAITDLDLSVGGTRFIEELSLEITSGEFVAIVGPNGSGKSTLLRAMYRALKPDAGCILIGSANVWDVAPRKAAQLRAVVTQHQTSNDSMLVRDIVATGRHAHQSWYRGETKIDRDHAEAALIRCGAAHMADRKYATLSGGERQRVLLARALTQDAPVLMLDEPTNHLDITAQHDLLNLLESVDLTRVVVLHDLNHAVAHADRIVVMHEGRIKAAGIPSETLTSELTREVFAVDSRLIEHPITGRPHLLTAPMR